jgi:hypothetical protein
MRSCAAALGIGCLDLASQTRLHAARHADGNAVLDGGQDKSWQSTIKSPHPNISCLP